MSIKLFKPYDIGREENCIYITLAYRYFDMLIDNNLYHFIPIASQKIIVDDQTKEIINITDRFAFQFEHKIIYIEMSELMGVPNFLKKVYDVIDVFMARKKHNTDRSPQARKETIELITYLEYTFIKQLIDRALDERNEKQFYELVKKLQRYELKINSF